MNTDSLHRQLKNGETLVEQGAVEEGLAVFDAILDQVPDCTEALNNKGAALYRMGKHDEAEKFFNRVLTLEMNNSDAVFNLITSAINQADWQRVDQLVQRYGSGLAEEDLIILRQTMEQKISYPSSRNPITTPIPSNNKDSLHADPIPLNRRHARHNGWTPSKLNLDMDVMAPSDPVLKDKFTIGTRLLLNMKSEWIRIESGIYRDFLDVYERVTEHTLLDFDRAFILYQAARTTVHLPGCTAECGVYRGGGSILIADLAPERTHYALDTYEGFPDTVTSMDKHEVGTFADVSYEHICNLLAPSPNIVMLKGPFHRSFKDIDSEIFSFVHLDADLYSSTRECLEFFFPRMTRGGILLLDDYLIPDTPGVKKALDEFLGPRKTNFIVLPTFQAMITVNS